jgi:hypothetical protein
MMTDEDSYCLVTTTYTHISCNGYARNNKSDYWERRFLCGSYQPTFRRNMLSPSSGLKNCHMLSCLAYSPTWKMVATFPPKRRLACNGLDGVITQKIELFIIIENSCIII